jgi:hypothetical protein
MSIFVAILGCPSLEMWRRARWGQTTIKRSSDFTHMMIIKIVVRVKYGKLYWNPDTALCISDHAAAVNFHISTNNLKF